MISFKFQLLLAICTSCTIMQAMQKEEVEQQEKTPSVVIASVTKSILPVSEFTATLKRRNPAPLVKSQACANLLVLEKPSARQKKTY